MKVIKMHSETKEAFDGFIKEQLEGVETDMTPADKYMNGMMFPPEKEPVRIYKLLIIVMGLILLLGLVLLLSFGREDRTIHDNAGQENTGINKIVKQANADDLNKRGDQKEENNGKTALLKRWERISYVNSEKINKVLSFPSDGKNKDQNEAVKWTNTLNSETQDSIIKTGTPATEKTKADSVYIIW